MTQVVSNKTGRKKIVKAVGENTEIKIIAKKFVDYLGIDTELKLNPEHKFKEDYSISLQAYEKKVLHMNLKIWVPWEIQMICLSI